MQSGLIHLHFHHVSLGPESTPICIVLHCRYLAHPWVRVRVLAATWCPVAALVWVPAWAPSSWASSRTEMPSPKAMDSPSCTDGPVPLTTRPRPTVEGTVASTAEDTLFMSNNLNHTIPTDSSYTSFVVPFLFQPEAQLIMVKKRVAELKKE